MLKHAARAADLAQPLFPGDCAEVPIRHMSLISLLYAARVVALSRDLLNALFPNSKPREQGVPLAKPFPNSKPREQGVLLAKPFPNSKPKE